MQTSRVGPTIYLMENETVYRICVVLVGLLPVALTAALLFMP